MAEMLIFCLPGFCKVAMTRKEGSKGGRKASEKAFSVRDMSYLTHL